MGSEENVCPQAWGGRGAVLREVRRLAASPPPGIKLLLQDDDLSQLTAIIAGPADTPYFGGAFRVRLALDGGYPGKAPRAVFETRIFHPNVSGAGEVCVSTLARDWRPELGLAHALVSVRALLLAPNAESALNAEAAALLRDDYAGYFARARLYTDIHALPADPDTDIPEAHKQGVEQSADGDEGPSAKRERRPAASRNVSTATTTAHSAHTAHSAPAGAGGGAGAGVAGGGAARAAADRRDRRRVLKRL